MNGTQTTEQSPPPHPVTGATSGSAPQIAYGGAPPYQQAAMAGAPSAAFPASSAQLTYQQAHQFHMQQQQQLQAFWAERVTEIEKTTDFKNHSLPLARIKKIMKADEDVRMISAEAPVVFAKACEIFILELTLRAWINTEENKRRTLQKNDIAAAITRTDIFDFLVDIVPRDELKEEGLGIPRAALPVVGGPVDTMPYYYVPPQHHVGVPPGMFMGKSVDQGAEMYATSQPQPSGYMSWQFAQPQLAQQQQGQQLQQHKPDND
ncbi:nuclear transcription factor Y subunit C-2-like [Iris pallida]|uniref:Nuclear transcription factor Y subunit C-2-like n=1 Tax=Iris pallida TaxID=29817 RepID=A0AAX6G4Y1_IRIPA|nr:nuclear transcription factor Y subunit C-2-like [Iris pallida]KAJ6823739.1 nuclear transcription factor Y subunit C-2-like [Iris pallida]